MYCSEEIALQLQQDEMTLQQIKHLQDSPQDRSRVTMTTAQSQLREQHSNKVSNCSHTSDLCSFYSVQSYDLN